MSKPPDTAHDWRVSLPVSDLLSLINQTQMLEDMKQDNAKLRREVDGLRNMFTEISMQFGDLKRELKGR